MIVTVKQARLLAGMTQAEISRELGVHVQTYAKYERDPDTMTIGRAKSFSATVRIPFDQIFFDRILPEVEEGDAKSYLW